MENSKLKNQGSTLILAVVILFIAVIFITGVYVWQEMKIADRSNKFLALVRRYDTPTNTRQKLEDTTDWQIYRSTNYKLSFSYPKEWSLYYDLDQLGIGLGPSDVTGEALWSIFIYDKSDDSLSDLIDQVGKQFTDRKVDSQEILIAGQKANKILVTTGQIKDWYAEQIFVEKAGKIYKIDNRAIGDDRFEIFYKSIKFTDQTADGSIFSCTQDSDCVAINNPSNACYKAYFHKNDLAAIEQFKKTKNMMIQDCPQYGPAVCKDNKCQAEFIKR